MTLKISISILKTAVLKNLLNFGEKSLGGRIEKLFGRIPFEQHLSLPGASLSSTGARSNVLLAPVLLRYC